MDLGFLKEELGNEARNIIFGDLSYSTRTDVCKCPYPDHNDKTASAKWYENSNHVWCFKCQKKYDIFNHFQEHHGMSEIESINHVKSLLGYDMSDFDEEQVKEYVEEQKEQEEEIRALFDLFEFREISQEILLDYGITKTKNDDEIGITYKNEKGNFLSYQTYDVNTRKQTMFPESDLLFNFNNIFEKDDIIIAFDIIDFLTLATLGYENIVAKSSKGGKFIDKYYKELEQKKSITLAFGEDISRNTLFNIIKRLGKENVKIVKFKNYHTINHALLSSNEDKIREQIDNASYLKVEGLRKLEELSLDEGSMAKPVMFGQPGEAFHGLDNIVDGMRAGGITGFVGRNNEGKTTAIQQIECNLIEQNHSVFVYDGESTPVEYKRKFYLKLVGDQPEYLKTRRVNVVPLKFPKKDVAQAISLWHKDKLLIKTSSEKRESQEDIFDLMRTAVKRYDCKVFFIDNLMTILQTNAENKYVDQANIVENLKRFAKAYYVHVGLVLHPNKTDDNTTLTKRDIHGASDIENKLDNIISIMRVKKTVNNGKFDNKYFDKTHDVDMVMDVLKNRTLGKLGRFYFQYNSKTDSFEEVVPTVHGEEVRPNNYSWEKYYNEDVEFYNGEKQQMTKEEAMKVLGGSPF